VTVCHWPCAKSRRESLREGEIWGALNLALRNGSCGLPGGSCLPYLPAERHGYQNRKALPPLTEAGILA
jgi:hypothetical protein